MLHLKLKLRFSQIISKMNQFIKLTFQEQVIRAKWGRPVLGIGLMGSCESQTTFYLDCFLSSPFLPAFKKN